MSKEEMGINDALLNMFEKTQEQYSTRQCEFHYIHWLCVWHYLIYVVYTEDEVCKIREEEANKWKDCTEEKDKMISVFTFRESLLKRTVDDLNKREADYQQLLETNFSYFRTGNPS